MRQSDDIALININGSEILFSRSRCDFNDVETVRVLHNASQWREAENALG
jgi:hypothetical protein